MPSRGDAGVSSRIPLADNDRYDGVGGARCALLARLRSGTHARLSRVCPPRRFEFARHPVVQPVEVRRGANTDRARDRRRGPRAAQSDRREARAAALDEVVLDQLGQAERVRIGGLVQLRVRVRPAQKARQGRNPATGEEITITAKPASVDLRARPLARAKGALPPVQKARRRLAA